MNQKQHEETMQALKVLAESITLLAGSIDRLAASETSVSRQIKSAVSVTLADVLTNAARSLTCQSESGCDSPNQKLQSTGTSTDSPSPADKTKQAVQTTQNHNVASQQTSESSPCHAEPAKPVTNTVKTATRAKTNAVASPKKSQAVSSSVQTSLSTQKETAKTIPVRTDLQPGKFLENYLKQHKLEFVEAFDYDSDDLIEIAKTIAENLAGFELFKANVRGSLKNRYDLSKSGLSEKEKNGIDAVANILNRHDFFSLYQNSGDKIILQFRDIPQNFPKRLLDGNWLEIFAYHKIAQASSKLKNPSDVEFYANLKLQDRNGQVHEFDTVVFVNGVPICIECKTGEKFSQIEVHRRFEFLGVKPGNGILIGTKLSKANKKNFRDKYQITACAPGSFNGIISKLITTVAGSDAETPQVKPEEMPGITNIEAPGGISDEMVQQIETCGAPAKTPDKDTNRSENGSCHQVTDTSAMNTEIKTDAEKSQTDSGGSSSAILMDPLDMLGHLIDKNHDTLSEFISSVTGVYANGNQLEGSYPENRIDSQKVKVIENTGKKMKETHILTEFGKDKQKHEYFYTVNPNPAALNFVSGDWYKYAVFFIFSKQGHIVCDEVRRDAPVIAGNNIPAMDLVLRIRDHAIYVKTACDDYKDKAKELASVSARLPHNANTSFVLVCRQIPDDLKRQLAAQFPITLTSKKQFEKALKDMIEKRKPLVIPA